MAGDYIPWCKGLVRKPEVAQIAKALKMSPFEVAGRLMCVWEWADEQTTDGFIHGASDSQVDMVAMHVGFADQMASTRPSPWLVKNDDGLMFPHFDRWNGRSAKRRLEDILRKRKARRADKFRT